MKLKNYYRKKTRCFTLVMALVFGLCAGGNRPRTNYQSTICFHLY